MKVDLRTVFLSVVLLVWAGTNLATLVKPGYTPPPAINAVFTTVSGMVVASYLKGKEEKPAKKIIVKKSQVKKATKRKG